jgi:flagellar hook-basal body complex protein FliE
MSGFELPPLLGGFDREAMQRFRLQQPGVDPTQDPEHALRPAGGEARPIGEGSRFGAMLADSLAQVRELQLDVRDKARGLALGEGVEVHDVLIASGKSEVAFNLLLEVRNKLVDAWEKLSRTAV